MYTSSFLRTRMVLGYLAFMAVALLVGAGTSETAHAQSCSVSFAPATVVPGGATTVTWNSTGDTDGQIAYACTGNIGNGNVPANGSNVVNPVTTQTCTLTVASATATNTCQATVSMTAGGLSCSLNFYPNALNSAGQPTTASWSSVGDADGLVGFACTGDIGSGALGTPNGTVTVSPGETQTCTLTVTNAAGSATCQSTVTVPPAAGCGPEGCTGYPGQPLPNFAPTAPPAITGASSTTISPGQSLTINGTNLGPTVTLTPVAGGNTHVLTGQVNTALTVLIVQIPGNITPGQYRVSVTNALGTTVAGAALTVNAAGGFIGTILPPIPPSAMTLGELIQFVFLYALYILGVSVFVMMLWAGFEWFTAAGNAGKVASARGKISNAIIGAIILLSAYIILYTINPDLIQGNFQVPAIPGRPNTQNPPPGTGGGVGTGTCRDTMNNTINYAGDLANAINAVISANPNGIADAMNTWANSQAFLDEVAAELQRQGFNATTNVRNGNDNQASGDLIAIWRSSDGTAERYDAVGNAGAGTTPLRNAARSNGFTGDIPLSCVN